MSLAVTVLGAAASPAHTQWYKIQYSTSEWIWTVQSGGNARYGRGNISQRARGGPECSAHQVGMPGTMRSREDPLKVDTDGAEYSNLTSQWPRLAHHLRMVQCGQVYRTVNVHVLGFQMPQNLTYVRGNIT